MVKREAITIEPRSAPYLEAAVRAGGASVVAPAEASAMIWTKPADPAALAAMINNHQDLGWVQLPWAGIEPYLSVMDHDRMWTNAKGIYAPPVAELALGLLLAGFRQVHKYARATEWSRRSGRTLMGAKVTIVGGGGIARSFTDLIAPFGCEVTVVRQHHRPFDGAQRVLTVDDLHEGLTGADAVVLALPLLAHTRNIIGEAELALLGADSWIINVARGAHIDTDALVKALQAGQIGGAGLDVTNPEPLPDGHPLWSLPNAIITPHSGNTQEMAKPLLGALVTENVRRWIAEEPLAAMVDLDLGY